MNPTEEHSREADFCIEEEEEEDHIEIKNFMVHEIRISMAEAEADSEEEVVEDTQTGDITMQACNVIIARNMVISPLTVHNTDLKTKLLILLRR
jgi:hypothetical protein